MAMYCVLAALIIFELLSIWIDALDRWVTEKGAIALLATALLFVCRMIDSQLQRQKPYVEAQRLGQIIGDMSRLPRPKDACVLANDGSKYVSLISDSNVTIRNLRLIVQNPSQLDKWQRLEHKGLIKKLEVRLLSEPPSISLMIRGRAGLVGFFVRQGNDVGLAQSFSVDGRTRDGEVLLTALKKTFDSEWANARVVPTGIEREGVSPDLAQP